MYCILKVLSIFCYISVTKAVTLKIDGLIDLGPTWSYEYRIVRPSDDTQLKPQLAELNHAARIRNQEERLHKDEERLRQGELRLHKEEERVRKEAEKLRLYKDRIPRPSETEKKVKKSKSEKHSKHKTYDSDDSKQPVMLREKTSKGHQKEKSHSEKREMKKETKKKKHATTKKEWKEEHIKEPKAERSQESDKERKLGKFSSPESESFGWSENSEEQTTQKSNTMFYVEDFTTSRTSKTHHRPIVRNDMNEQKTGPLNEQGASLPDDYLKNDNSNTKKLKQSKEKLAAPLNSVNVTTTVKPVVTNATIPTTTQVTTVRTDEIYSAPHKVKDDAKINDFTNHIVKQTLKVFDTIKQKTNQYYLRKQVDILAKSYQEKLQEFLKDTRHQNIKTRLGTQKVILNTIDMSNRILKRLINYMIGDMDKKGVLRHNVATANIFQKEIEKEQNLELSHACKKFGICRTGDGFPEFLTDVIKQMLTCDDKKFKQSIDALTEVVKGADFYKVLDNDVERKLKSAVENIEFLGTITLRALMMIVKNMIWNKNKPLVVHSSGMESRVNATLAFLEIIDLLDQHSPRNEANILEWNDIRKSMKEYSEGKRNDVQDIMETFVKHLKKTIKAMDDISRKIISKNLNKIL